METELETLELDELETLESGDAWMMVWDHFSTSVPESMATWLDKGILRQKMGYLAKVVTQAAMNLSPTPNEEGVELTPELLVEAFQATFPAVAEVSTRTVPSELEEKLNGFLESLDTSA